MCQHGRALAAMTGDRLIRAAALVAVAGHHARSRTWSRRARAVEGPAERRGSWRPTAAQAGSRSSCGRRSWRSASGAACLTPTACARWSAPGPLWRGPRPSWVTRAPQPMFSACA